MVRKITIAIDADLKNLEKIKEYFKVMGDDVQTLNIKVKESTTKTQKSVADLSNEFVTLRKQALAEVEHATSNIFDNITLMEEKSRAYHEQIKKTLSEMEQLRGELEGATDEESQKIDIALKARRRLLRDLREAARLYSGEAERERAKRESKQISGIPKTEPPKTTKDIFEQWSKTIRNVIKGETERDSLMHKWRKTLTGVLIDLHVLRVLGQHSMLVSASIQMLGDAIGYLIDSILMPAFPAIIQLADYIFGIADWFNRLAEPIKKVIGYIALIIGGIAVLSNIVASTTGALETLGIAATHAAAAEELNATSKTAGAAGAGGLLGTTISGFLGSILFPAVITAVIAYVIAKLSAPYIGPIAEKQGYKAQERSPYPEDPLFKEHYGEKGWGDVSFFASGGPLRFGETAIVGEAGPEMLIPTPGGFNVIPNKEISTIPKKDVRYLQEGTEGGNVWTTMGDISEAVTGLLSSGFEFISEMFETVYTGAAMGVAPGAVLPTEKDPMKSILAKGLTSVYTAVTAGFQTSNMLVSAILALMVHGTTTPGETPPTKTIWDFILTPAKEIWEFIITTPKMVWDFIITPTKQIWDFIIITTKQIWEFIITIPRSIWEWITTPVKSVWEFITTPVKSIWDFIVVKTLNISDIITVTNNPIVVKTSELLNLTYDVIKISTQALFSIVYDKIILKTSDIFDLRFTDKYVLTTDDVIDVKHIEPDEIEFPSPGWWGNWENKINQWQLSIEKSFLSAFIGIEQKMIQGIGSLDLSRVTDILVGSFKIMGLDIGNKVNWDGLKQTLTDKWINADWRTEANKWVNALAPAMMLSFGGLGSSLSSAVTSAFSKLGIDFGPTATGIGDKLATAFAMIFPTIGTSFKDLMTGNNSSIAKNWTDLMKGNNTDISSNWSSVMKNQNQNIANNLGNVVKNALGQIQYQYDTGEIYNEQLEPYTAPPVTPPAPKTNWYGSGGTRAQWDAMDANERAAIVNSGKVYTISGIQYRSGKTYEPREGSTVYDEQGNYIGPDQSGERSTTPPPTATSAPTGTIGAQFEGWKEEYTNAIVRREMYMEATGQTRQYGSVNPAHVIKNNGLWFWKANNGNYVVSLAQGANAIQPAFVYQWNGEGELPGLWKGGSILSHGAAVVGERGPEIVELPRGAEVQPIAAQNTSSGGPTYNIYNPQFNITTNDARNLFDEFMRLMQIEGRMVR